MGSEKSDVTTPLLKSPIPVPNFPTYNHHHSAPPPYHHHHLQAFTPVITMMCMFIARLEDPSAPMIVSILLIATGVVVAAYGELNFSATGTERAWGFARFPQPSRHTYPQFSRPLQPITVSNSVYWQNTQELTHTHPQSNTRTHLKPNRHTRLQLNRHTHIFSPEDARAVSSSTTRMMAHT